MGKVKMGANAKWMKRSSSLLALEHVDVQTTLTQGRARVISGIPQFTFPRYFQVPINHPIRMRRMNNWVNCSLTALAGISTLASEFVARHANQ